MRLEEEFCKANCKKLTPRVSALHLCPPAEGFLNKNVDGAVNDVRECVDWGQSFATTNVCWLGFVLNRVWVVSFML